MMHGKIAPTATEILTALKQLVMDYERIVAETAEEPRKASHEESAAGTAYFDTDKFNPPESDCVIRLHKAGERFEGRTYSQDAHRIPANHHLEYTGEYRPPREEFAVSPFVRCALYYHRRNDRREILRIVPDEPEYHAGDLVWWDGTDGIGNIIEEQPRTAILISMANDRWDFMLAGDLGWRWGINKAAIRHLTDEEWTVAIDVDGEPKRVRFYEYTNTGHMIYVDTTSTICRRSAYSYGDIPCDVLARSIIRAHYPVMSWSMVKRLYGDINNVPRPEAPNADEGERR